MRANNIKALVCGLAVIGLLNTGCQKETQIIYNVNDVSVAKPDGEKGSVKTVAEFISIAYTDLFGQAILQSQLLDLDLAYRGFGDLKMVEDLIIKNFLNDTGLDIPTDSDMRANPSIFIQSSYQKFYNRNPSEFEEWQLKAMIEEDAAITPELVYYAMMTSNEYRYY
jgi:hypothetical protein